VREANSNPRLYNQGLAQAVDGVIFILAIYVTPLGATGFMRRSSVAMRVTSLSQYFHFGSYTGSPNEKCRRPK
jgi:hypothetical protein